jgi:hypothetical protein
MFYPDFKEDGSLIQKQNQELPHDDHQFDTELSSVLSAHAKSLKAISQEKPENDDYDHIFLGLDDDIENFENEENLPSVATEAYQRYLNEGGFKDRSEDAASYYDSQDSSRSLKALNRQREKYLETQGIEPSQNNYQPFLPQRQLKFRKIQRLSAYKK